MTAPHHIERISFAKGEWPVLLDGSLDGIPRGILMVLCPNGSGKTSPLRPLAGLERSSIVIIDPQAQRIAAMDEQSFTS